MKRIAMIAAATLMTLVLGACGDKEPKSPEVTTPDSTMGQSQEQMSAPAEDSATKPTDTPEASDVQAALDSKKEPRNITSSADVRAQANDAPTMPAADTTMPAADTTMPAADATTPATDSATTPDAAADSSDDNDDDDDTDSES